MEPLAISSSSLMSNTKWRKFFRVAAEHPGGVFAATWKLVGCPESEHGYLPERNDIWESAVDRCVRGGPVKYKLIEWIEVPVHVPYRRYPNAPVAYRSQDVQAFRFALSSVAQFPLEETDSGLRARGYA